ncbi:acetyltransferase (GNAT) domain-containing protein [Ditylenchus destructor]|nr:acetyltransferase (GNAT) domain-containing protein [Ditylenchus destructor]
MPICEDLSKWTPRQYPEKKVFEGRYVRIEPLDVAKHGDELYEVSSVPDAAERFRYMMVDEPKSREEFQPWLEEVEKSVDPLYFVVIDKKTGKVAGRQTLMRIDTAFGVIEIGHIYWGPLISRTPAATEAQFLFMTYIFEELGYRRYEWKCHSKNEKSRRAAQRFGFTFEAIFRQHKVHRGENYDSAWFACLDKDWAKLKPAYEKWLSPENFDENGVQIKKLEDFRKEFE